MAGPEKLALKEAVFLRPYSPHVCSICNYPEDVPEATGNRARRAGMEIGTSWTMWCLADAGLMWLWPWPPTRKIDLLYPAMVRLRSELACDVGAVCDKDGCILIGPHSESSVERLYAIGDAARALNRIAVGFGHAALAATHINSSLSAFRQRRA